MQLGDRFDVGIGVGIWDLRLRTCDDGFWISDLEFDIWDLG